VPIRGSGFRVLAGCQDNFQSTSYGRCTRSIRTSAAFRQGRSFPLPQSFDRQVPGFGGFYPEHQGRILPLYTLDPEGIPDPGPAERVLAGYS
jgi:hypothetical protein